jgi:hypothetical protein
LQRIILGRSTRPDQDRGARLLYNKTEIYHKMNTKSEAGRLGGIATRDRYGSEHFRKIGKRGAQTTWTRYKLVPVAQDNFAMVHRKTGEVKAFLNGVPF